MKKFLLLSVMAVLLGGAASEASAQRRGNDRQRIRQGIRSGQITRNEAREIRERRQQIRNERRTYRSDGVVTREERREIRRDRREQDRYIRSQRRDDDRNTRRRGNGYWRRGAGSPSHPVFGDNNRRRGRGRN
jgi:Spy/CpxP family protein refolding chaperone